MEAGKSIKIAMEHKSYGDSLASVQTDANNDWIIELFLKMGVYPKNSACSPVY
ncbi:hypothetical protein V7150_16630 [Neobacillus drentensis]